MNKKSIWQLIILTCILAVVVTAAWQLGYLLIGICISSVAYLIWSAWQWRDLVRRGARLRSTIVEFRQAIDAFPDAVVILNLENEAVWCNNAAADLLGVHDSGDYKPPASLLQIPKLKRYLLRQEYDEPLEMTSPADKKITLSIRVVAYGEAYYLLVARDITHLQKLEQMRRDFVGNVSHEMRTPLTVIYGYLDTLLEQPDLETWQPVFAQMHQQTARMTRLVGDLLLLSRLETHQLSEEQQETVNIPELLADIYNEALMLAKESAHHVTLDVKSKLGLYGKPDELRSAFSNLVINALRYSPPESTVQIRWFDNEKSACFEVKDNGPGIAPKHIPRLTERFYRADTARSRTTGGTGLGLAIVKHVLLRHDGHLSIHSVLGEGSTFTCCFPRERVKKLEEPAAGA